MKRFQGSTFDESSRRRLIEDRDTILDLTAKIQELQNEVNCMNDSRDFKDAESVRSGQSHVTSVLPIFFQNPGGMLSTPATFACWKIRFKTEVCTCSQFPKEAMQWIKEVEMVDSVDDFKSSSSVRRIQMPNFEVLDARIASALNRIIHNSHFKRGISLEEQKAQKEDRFLSGRQIAYLMYECFRVTGANDSVENYADLFSFVLRNGDIQEFDQKWNEILLSMTQITSDDILESLYKLRIRESEKLKTVLELYNMELHQKKIGLDYHRLKTMVRRSVEQDLRNRNFGARNGKFERNAVVKNPGTKQRAQSLADCWQLQFPTRYE